MNSELHPLEPFLPANARVLMLGSFPPKRIRWSMDFFYPNLQNDMWRIVGYLATGDKSKVVAVAEDPYSAVISGGSTGSASRPSAAAAGSHSTTRRSKSSG